MILKIKKGTYKITKVENANKTLADFYHPMKHYYQELEFEVKDAEKTPNKMADKDSSNYIKSLIQKGKKDIADYKTFRSSLVDFMGDVDLTSKDLQKIIEKAEYYI